MSNEKKEFSFWNFQIVMIKKISRKSRRHKKIAVSSIYELKDQSLYKGKKS